MKKINGINGEKQTQTPLNREKALSCIYCSGQLIRQFSKKSVIFIYLECTTCKRGQMIWKDEFYNMGRHPGDINDKKEEALALNTKKVFNH